MSSIGGTPLEMSARINRTRELFAALTSASRILLYFESDLQRRMTSQSVVLRILSSTNEAINPPPPVIRTVAMLLLRFMRPIVKRLHYHWFARVCCEQIRRIERFVYDILIAPRHLNRIAPVFSYQSRERHAVAFHYFANPNVV